VLTVAIKEWILWTLKKINEDKFIYTVINGMEVTDTFFVKMLCVSGVTVKKMLGLSTVTDLTVNV